MPRGTPKLEEGEFIEAYERLGQSAMAKKYGLHPTNINQRRQRIERARGVTIEGPKSPWSEQAHRIPAPQANHRVELEIKNGHVIVFSDAHYWPPHVTLMHKALVHFIRELKPKIVIANGDVMDLPKASRHASIGWEKRPEIHEEIEFTQERLHEVELAAGPGVRKIWTLGNHDARFESRIANLAPEYAKVKGVHLKDHHPNWETAWSTFINNDVLIKHRFKGGMNAVHSNLLWSGVHTITGHLHSAQVRALTLYNERTIWGMDTGCVAEPNSAAFINYTEDNPRSWRSAFGILTFYNGRLMQPELVLKWDDAHVQFRGEVIRP